MLNYLLFDIRKCSLLSAEICYTDVIQGGFFKINFVCRYWTYVPEKWLSVMTISNICINTTLIVSWSARSLETCPFQLRMEIVKYHKKKAVGHISSSVFQIQKNVDRLDKLQVNTQTDQSREVDPNQTKSLDLKVPAFHRHLDPDPKISAGPICTKGWIKTMSKSPSFSSLSLSSEDVWIWNQVWKSLLTSFSSWVVVHTST